MHFTFPKNEKLCGKRNIDTLFSKGKHINAPPFRLVYFFSDERSVDAPVKLLISVPKKKVRKAVDRNHIKRMIREAYRLNKKNIIEKSLLKNKRIHLAVLYYGSIEIKLNFTEKKLDYLLKSLASVLDKTT